MTDKIILECADRGEDKPLHTSEEFVECDQCRAKPGIPDLCRGCLHNRSLISALKAKLEYKVSKAQHALAQAATKVEMEAHAVTKNHLELTKHELLLTKRALTMACCCIERNEDCSPSRFITAAAEEEKGEDDG
jgi:hypothetical protein